jgi:membrane protein
VRRLLDTVRALGDELSHRWRWLEVALQVNGRFNEVHGGYVASAITLAAFLSLFPLLLVLTAVAGFVQSSGTDVAGEVVSQLGLTGEAASTITDGVRQAEESRRAASVVGFVGLLWSGLGVVGALEHAYGATWQATARGIKDRLFALGWLAGAVTLFVASFALTAVVNLVPLLAPLNLVVGGATSFLLFWWTSRVLSSRDVGWRPLVPGAIAAAVGFEVLKAVGAFYVPRVVASSSALYGSIGVVFAVLAWLFLLGRLVVYSSCLNVVLWERRHGTVSVPIDAPVVPGATPTGANRSGEAEVDAAAESDTS